MKREVGTTSGDFQTFKTTAAPSHCAQSVPEDQRGPEGAWEHFGGGGNRKPI